MQTVQASAAPELTTRKHLELKRPKFALIQGKPPVFMMLSVHSVSVDRRYQRGENRQKAMEIAREWNWNAVKAISVARRPDGSLFGYDGQHTLVAAKLRGDIQEVPCLVREIETVADEAKAFLATNSKQTKPTKAEMHHAGAAGADPLANMIQGVLDEFNIELTKSTYGPRKTTAIGSFYGVVGPKPTKDARERLLKLLTRLLETWPNDEMVLSGRFVEGMSRFLSAVEQQDIALVPKALVKLSKHETRYYLAKGEAHAKALGRPILRTLVDFLAETYNHQLGRNSRIGQIDLQ
jgi:hypothetical protein